jgi:hypothetical protein
LQLVTDLQLFLRGEGFEKILNQGEPDPAAGRQPRMTRVEAGPLALAVIPLIVIMLVAISTTKIPILADKGFWSMAHESRTDYAMLLGSLFLLAAGAGRWSVDALIGRR